MKRGMILSGLVLLLAAACSDSDNNRAPTPLPVVNADDIVVVGPVSGFGSVIVNGVQFDTAAAIVTMDDEPGTVSDLRIGMIVSIGGTIDSDTGLAHASEISFVDDAEGPITSMDRAAGSFVVLGRTVFVDELTVFEGTTFEDLEVGHVVEVSGLWKHQQQIQAAFVRHVANQFMVGMTMQVKGEITDLDIGQQRFRIGTQSCDYSAAMLELGGDTLLERAIKFAAGADEIDRVLVSTDDQEMYDISERHGVAPPTLRPAEYADDAATTDARVGLIVRRRRASSVRPSPFRASEASTRGAQ